MKNSTSCWGRVPRIRGHGQHRHRRTPPALTRGAGRHATGEMLEADLLRKQIRICKSLTDKPFGVNLMLMNPCADEMAQIIIEEGAFRW